VQTAFCFAPLKLHSMGNSVHLSNPNVTFKLLQFLITLAFGRAVALARAKVQFSSGPCLQYRFEQKAGNNRKVKNKL
jgi:hypothetical protein